MCVRERRQPYRYRGTFQVDLGMKCGGDDRLVLGDKGAMAVSDPNNGGVTDDLLSLNPELLVGIHLRRDREIAGEDVPAPNRRHHSMGERVVGLVDGGHRLDPATNVDALRDHVEVVNPKSKSRFPCRTAPVVPGMKGEGEVCDEGGAVEGGSGPAVSEVKRGLAHGDQCRAGGAGDPRIMVQRNGGLQGVGTQVERAIRDGWEELVLVLADQSAAAGVGRVKLESHGAMIHRQADLSE